MCSRFMKMLGVLLYVNKITKNVTTIATTNLIFCKNMHCFWCYADATANIVTLSQFPLSWNTKSIGSKKIVTTWDRMSISLPSSTVKTDVVATTAVSPYCAVHRGSDEEDGIHGRTLLLGPDYVI